MKQTVSEYDFRKAFSDMGRESNFSSSGLDALYEYLESYRDDTGEEVELDVIALCCDFTEYGSVLEAACEYFDFPGMEYDEDGGELDTAEEVDEKAIKYLRDRTTVIEFNGGIIIQNF